MCTRRHVPLSNRKVARKSHRLHLLPRFDTIVLLDGGRVVDAGSLDGLLERQPLFREMWRGYTSDASGSGGAGIRAA